MLQRFSPVVFTLYTREILKYVSFIYIKSFYSFSVCHQHISVIALISSTSNGSYIYLEIENGQNVYKYVQYNQISHGMELTHVTFTILNTYMYMFHLTNVV